MDQFNGAFMMLLFVIFQLASSQNYSLTLYEKEHLTYNIHIDIYLKIHLLCQWKKRVC